MTDAGHHRAENRLPEFSGKKTTVAIVCSIDLHPKNVQHQRQPTFHGHQAECSARSANWAPIIGANASSVGKTSMRMVLWAVTPTNRSQQSIAKAKWLCFICLAEHLASDLVQLIFFSAQCTTQRTND